MRTRTVLILFGFVFLTLPLAAREKKAFFSLNTDKTFQPGEKPKIQVLARDVDVLEFRLYKVNNTLKFFEGLQNVHQFGAQYSPRERIDERTWLERFHDWKAHWWRRLRNFVRSQFSAESRAEIREAQSTRAERSKVTGAAGFANIPLLNAQQMIARWRMDLPPKYVSESSDLPIDALPAGVYVVEATDGVYRAYTVLSVSRLAMVTKSAPGQLLAYSVQRSDGAPVAGVSVTTWFQRKVAAQFQTDAQGLGSANIPILASQATEAAVSEEDGSQWVLAQKGDDIALVAPYSLNLSSDPSRDWSGYIYTDRPVYRPGDAVDFKGILRRREGERFLLPAEKQLQVTIENSDRNTVLKQTLVLSKFGSFHGTLALPKTASLGYYTISISHGYIGGNFQVLEYKKPEYFVKVTPASARVLQGESMKVAIEARYYFGEPVAGAKVKYVVHTQRSYFFSGGDDDAGEAENSGGGDEGAPGDNFFYGEQVLEAEGTLDANGRLTITIPTKVESKYKSDVDYRVEARVTDAANREIAGHNAFLATYGPFHLEVTPQSYLFNEGEACEVTVKAEDYDKKSITTPVHLELGRTVRGQKWQLFQSADVQTGADGTARTTFRCDHAGSLRVRATASTSIGRSVLGEGWLWVAGKNEGSSASPRELQIIADKGAYKIGDTAHLALSGVLRNASVLLTTEGGSVLTSQVLRVANENPVIDIPITVDSQPFVNVSAVFIWQNNIYQGTKQLKVPPVERRLNVEITPSSPQFQPGQPALYNITVRDWHGKPVEAELSIGVVDDAVYAVQPDTSGDILNAFYGNRPGWVQTANSFEFNFHGEAGTRTMPIALSGSRSGHRALAQVKASDFVQPNIRKAFPDTAYWQATVVTDATGKATARLQFPDSLTTWRTTVRGVTLDTRAGWAVNRVLVRKNLLVRLALPRFFRDGDEVTISAIVHNYLEAPKVARVSLDATGLEIIEGSTRDVTIPSRGEAKLDWRVHTLKGATSAKLLTKALTNEESDGLELTLPIVPFGVKQTIAASGSMSDQSAQNQTDIKFPDAIEPSTRSINLELSPSIAGTIFAGLDYLTSFPYGCTEQTMSSFLPDVIVSKALQDLQIKSSIDPAQLKIQVNAGLQRLYDFQHPDGGWGWWKEDDSMVFMTAYVVSGLSQAAAAGYPVKSDVIANGKQFLGQALARHPNMIADLRSYVTYALAVSGESNAESIDSVWNKRDKLSPEGLAFAGLTLNAAKDGRASEIAGMLRSTAKTEGDAVYWQAKKDDLLDIYEDTSPEATACAIKFLSSVAPDDPLLPKAVLWLTRNRSGGYYWESTKQTAMVIYGLTDYLKYGKELDPHFSADVALNGKPVLTRNFSAQDVGAIAPAALHVDGGGVAPNNQLTITKNGTGRLYWSSCGTYYSVDQKLYSRGTYSLNIARDYYKLAPATRDGRIVYDLSALSGSVATGDTLAVRVTVSGSAWRYLLVEDPIPAGTEFVEHDELYEVSPRPSRWGGGYYRRELHDDHMAIFQTAFDKQQEYFYLLKVVNPGLFRISPASAQPMYQPGVQATTAPTTLEVR
ncbi:MAG: alpha-2-macroglobulin [Acidobacteriales bacterium]|nr:alpha-2-macroglobulin [Terriglobales bacterium]